MDCPYQDRLSSIGSGDYAIGTFKLLPFWEKWISLLQFNELLCPVDERILFIVQPAAIWIKQ